MLLDFDELNKKYQFNINGILHIGAHEGQEFKIYDKYNIKNIIFFEPVPSTYEKLKSNIGNKAILVNKALGNQNKITSMYIEESNAGQSSSILQPLEHLKLFPWIKFNKMINVEMIRLDDYLIYSQNYYFINIDVQGYELEVFKGAEKTLSNIDYIITEVNRLDVYKSCVKIDQLDSYLNTYGFCRVETSWYDIGWGDALYIKRNN
jgi:FkbM family methyltransferase